jgi:tRNA(Arg) A34 adenosine deaminase TadA
MWDDLALPWQICLEQAWLAYCTGCVPIGAAVAGPDGRILSVGRNRIHQPVPEDGYIHGQTLAHAELNALIRLPAEGEINVHACALYTAVEPCPLCMGALYMSGVRSLHFAARDTYAGSANLLGATPYLSRKPIQVFGPVRADLETAVTAINVVYHLYRERRNETAILRLLETWEQELGPGVRLGRALHRRGDLQQLKASQATAGQAFSFLLRAAEDEIRAS